MPPIREFAFSFAGTAFFVVGLHAASSRMARRFAWPTLMFNPHDQFDRLRETGRYPRFQQVIRDGRALTARRHQSHARRLRRAVRSVAVLGTPGRATSWRCPFHARTGTDPGRQSKEGRDGRQRIEPQRGSAFDMSRGDTLRVIDPSGEQVADFVAFARADVGEWLSSGRTLDYNNTIYLTTGPRAVFQPQHGAAHHHRRHGRPSRLPLHALQSGDVRHSLQDQRASSQLLREPGRQPQALRHRERSDSRRRSTSS